MKEKGHMPTEEMIIVCEQFNTIWTRDIISNKNKQLRKEVGFKNGH